MLVIRQGQMEALRHAARSAFRRRLSAHVRSFRPDAGDAEMTKLCDSVMSDCAAYSIERECDIARYALIILASARLRRSCSRKRLRIFCWRMACPPRNGCRNLKDLPPWQAGNSWGTDRCSQPLCRVD